MSTSGTASLHSQRLALLVKPSPYTFCTYRGWDHMACRVWDLASGQLKTTLTGHTDFVSSVAISPDGATLASGSWDETIR
jgi:WD40 repeat protein